MVKKEITAYHEKLILACDGNCKKAWGINNRPRRQLSDTDDDYVFLPDSELPVAPRDPGTYEGGHGKPDPELNSPEKLNKWCFRECERSSTFELNENIILPDLEHPEPNMKR